MKNKVQTQNDDIRTEITPGIIGAPLRLAHFRSRDLSVALVPASSGQSTATQGANNHKLSSRGNVLIFSMQLIRLFSIDVRAAMSIFKISERVGVSTVKLEFSGECRLVLASSLGSGIQEYLNSTYFPVELLIQYAIPNTLFTNLGLQLQTRHMGLSHLSPTTSSSTSKPRSDQTATAEIGVSPHIVTRVSHGRPDLHSVAANRSDRWTSHPKYRAIHGNSKGTFTGEGGQGPRVSTLSLDLDT
ncbi:aminopeptidase N [Striga asiatica]|uniref:Aminopeptidase N n=1 Tax=Striga asiatica TaxID=4170 RepID=A0A5A7Q7C4_STRAF|nr:aminopeptidase N [Striga asiatica]